MPTIDTSAMLAEITIILDRVHLSIAALDNYLRLDLSRDEKTQAGLLREKYVDWQTTFTILQEQTLHTQELGYPNYPRLEVPAAMAKTLDREAEETAFGRALFYTSAPAVTATVTFAEPQKKDVSEQ